MCTQHVIIDWHRMIIAFIEKETRAERIFFLADFNYSKANIKNSWTYLIKLLVYVIQTFIGDFIMVRSSTYSEPKITHGNYFIGVSMLSGLAP